VGHKVFASSVTAIFIWTALLPSIFLAGSFVSSKLGEKDLLMKGILNIAFGFGIFVYAMMLFGNIGFLKPWPIVCFIGIILLFRFRVLHEFGVWSVSLLRFAFWEGGVATRVLQGLFLFAVIFTGVLSFVPEIANDSLCYQLNLPKVFVKKNSIQPLTYDFNSFIPLFMNYLYMIGFVFKNVVVAKLFHWWTGVFLSIALMVMIFRATKWRQLAVFMALIFFLTPTVWNQITTAYIDVAVAFFTFLSFYLFLQGRRTYKSVTFLLSGLLMGFAVGCKLLAMMGVLSVGGILLLDFFRVKDKREILTGMGFFSVGVFAGCGYWFVSNAILTGNPAYPYFTKYLGPEVLDFGATYAKMGLPKSIISYLLTPFHITFQPQYFDRGHWVGPFYLFVLPLVLFASVRMEKSRYASLFVLCFVTIWFFMGQNVRYLLPVLPLYLFVAALGVYGLKEWFYSKWGSLVMKGSVVLFTSFLILLGVYHYRFQLKVISGLWSPDTFLTKMERSYPIAKWINRELPKDAVVLNAEEVRQFYLDRDLIREEMLHLKENYTENKSSEEIILYLKKMGFTHILRSKMIQDSKPVVKGDWLEPLDRLLENTALTQRIVSMNSKNIREPKYHYDLYEIR